ncbi:MAG: hypothetical protein NTZ05_15595, partial [Chloroflexi bacterium]|nr:hypothetical protein [Chloroflexota bacterium]
MDINLIEIDQHGMVTIELDYEWCKRLKKACQAATFHMYGAEPNRDVFNLPDGATDDPEQGALYDTAAALFDVLGYIGYFMGNKPSTWKTGPDDRLSAWHNDVMGYGPTAQEMEDQHQRNLAQRELKSLTRLGPTADLVQMARQLRAANDQRRKPDAWDLRNRTPLPGDPNYTPLAAPAQTPAAVSPTAGDGLTDEDRELLAMYREATPEKKDALLADLRRRA